MADSAGSKTILLIDDEQSVRAVVMRILKRANFNVLEAQDGADALRVAGLHSGAIDLVVTDMFMPGMRGPDVVQQLLPQRPGLRVLFMSGYADQDSRSGAPAGSNFLNKPFSGQELGAAVDAALKGPPASI